MFASRVLGRAGFLVFSLAQIAVAQVVVELVPDNPGPYAGGEIITVDVWLHSNLTEEHGLALIQFDFSLAHLSLSLAPAFTFDFSPIANPDYYNEQHPELPVPWTWNTLECCPEYFLQLPPGGVLHIGSVGMQLPVAHGIYRLDALNAVHASPATGQAGGLIGSTYENFPWEAFAGEITGGVFDFVVPPPIPTISGAALLLLAVLLVSAGSWIVARRSRCGPEVASRNSDGGLVKCLGITNLLF